MMSDYGYGDDMDYDVDPVDFQMYGYGGFGYHTSQVAKDEPKSLCALAAEAGDLARVRSLSKGPKSAEGKAKVLNHGRRWTEVDYRASGFTKEYEWYNFCLLLLLHLRACECREITST